MSLFSALWYDAKDGFVELRRVFGMIRDRLRRGYPLTAALVLTFEELQDVVDDGIEELEALIDENEADIAEWPDSSPGRDLLEKEIAKAREDIERIKRERT